MPKVPDSLRSDVRDGAFDNGLLLIKVAPETVRCLCAGTWTKLVVPSPFCKGFFRSPRSVQTSAMGIRAFLEADQIAALRAPPQEMLDRAAVDEDLHLVPSKCIALLEDLKLAAHSAHDDVTRGLLHKWITTRAAVAARRLEPG